MSFDIILALEKELMKTKRFFEQAKINMRVAKNELKYREDRLKEAQANINKIRSTKEMK